MRRIQRRSYSNAHSASPNLESSQWVKVYWIIHAPCASWRTIGRLQWTARLLWLAFQLMQRYSHSLAGNSRVISARDHWNYSRNPSSSAWFLSEVHRWQWISHRLSPEIVSARLACELLQRPFGRRHSGNHWIHWKGLILSWRAIHLGKIQTFSFAHRDAFRWCLWALFSLRSVG